MKEDKVLREFRESIHLVKVVSAVIIVIYILIFIAETSFILGVDVPISSDLVKMSYNNMDFVFSLDNSDEFYTAITQAQFLSMIENLSIVVLFAYAYYKSNKILKGADIFESNDSKILNRIIIFLGLLSLVYLISQFFFAPYTVHIESGTWFIEKRSGVDVTLFSGSIITAIIATSILSRVSKMGYARQEEMKAII